MIIYIVRGYRLAFPIMMYFCPRVIAPDKDSRQLGIYPTSFWLNWVFQILNWVFQVFVLGIYLKANKK